MANIEKIAFNAASFICALFVLELGADKFIGHTAIVAKRTGIPQTVIALLTAGAEWEELTVVVFSIAHGRSSLAIGNIVGSAISNILGAFSLGLLCHKDAIVFDHSSRVYSLLLASLTSVLAGLLGIGTDLPWRAIGGIAVGLFAVYIASIAWAISKGRVVAPELSDSDDSDDSGVDEPQATLARSTSYGTRQNSESGLNAGEPPARERQPLLGSVQTTVKAGQLSRPRATSASSLTTEASDVNTLRNGHRSLPYHVAVLLVGFSALTLSAYVLSQAASTLAAEFGISDAVFGVVILSIATTLPEKFIAAVSGSEGHSGIMVANTVGSNIFLLTLCLGILWLTMDGQTNERSVSLTEIGVMLGSTVWMTLAIWYGAKWARYIGGAMLVVYVAFIVVELTVM